MSDERTLPHDLEAERLVLGSILLHDDAYILSARVLKPSDFYRDAHRRIYEALVTLLERPNGSADVTLVRAELQRRGDFEDVGGAAYLAALVDGIPRATNVTHYAQLVKDAALLRALISVANKMLSVAYNAEETAEQILNHSDRALVSLRHGFGTGRMLSTKKTATALMDDLDHRIKTRGQLSGLDTSFKSLNEITNGWQRGDVIVLAARPSMGKTAFMLNTLRPTLQEGKHVAVFSFEMRRRQLEYRMLSSLSGVMLQRLVGGYISPDATDWAPVQQAIEWMASAELHIDDTAGMRIEDVRARCRQLRAGGGLDFVVVDYIQLMPGSLDRKGATRNEELTDISRRFKILADELNVPVMVLSQLKRLATARPQLDDLRESGALEQDADIVAFLHRKHHREGGKTELILEKQRNGATGTVLLDLNRDTVTFTDWDASAHPAPAPEKPEEDPEKARRRQWAVRNQRRKPVDDEARF